MKIPFKTKQYTFVPWRPSDGRVMTRKFAFDTETTLIDENRPWLTPAYVLGAAFDGKTGVFVPRDRVAAFFKAHEGLAIIAHNAAFDLKVIHQIAPDVDIYKAVDENRVWDTMLLYQLFALGTEGTVAGGKGQATLELLARKFLDVKLPKDVLDQDGDPVRLSYSKWLHRPLQEITEPYLRYLALDVVATLRVYVRVRRKLATLLRGSPGTYGFVSNNWLREQVEKHGPQTHHTQLKAAIALDAIAVPGLHIDPTQREPLAIRLTAEVERLKQDLAGHGYLPGGKGSDKALQAILSRIAKQFPNVVWPCTAKGKFATRKEVLEDLAVHVPFVELLLKYRTAAKLKSTFVDKLTANVIHPRFRTLTRSGRTSSYGQLNVQNLPRGGGVRECFIPSPGHVLLAADYSTIELVTLAQACESQFGLESRMAEAIRNGLDLHRLVAGQVTGKNPSDVTKVERSKAKPINFGKPGGMGDATLRAYAKMNYGVDLSEDDVRRLSEAWFATFPEMKQFLADESDAIRERVAETVGMTPADHERHTGDDRFLWNLRTPGDAHRPNKYLGAMLLKAAAEPAPTRLRDGRPYSDADIDYFWSKLDAMKDELPEAVSGFVSKREPCYSLKRAVRSLCDRAGVFTLTGRLRANTGYCERHNTVFQGLAADGAKLALWKLWRAGLRVVNFVHDEFIVEVPESANLSAEAERIKALIIAGMKEVVPDLPVKVEYAAMSRWSKDAEPKVDSLGQLVVWEQKVSAETTGMKPAA